MSLWERVAFVVAVGWLILITAANDPFNSYERDEWFLGGLLPFVMVIGMIWILRAWNERRSVHQNESDTAATKEPKADSWPIAVNSTWKRVRWLLSGFTGVALLGMTAAVILGGSTDPKLPAQMGFAAGVFAALTGIKPKHNQFLTMLVGIVWFAGGFVVWGFAVAFIKRVIELS